MVRPAVGLWLLLSTMRWHGMVRMHDAKVYTTPVVVAYNIGPVSDWRQEALQEQ